MNADLARRMWWATEPYHAVVYFAPETREAYSAIGLKGFWTGYLASRAAPMGSVPPAVEQEAVAFPNPMGLPPPCP